MTRSFPEGFLSGPPSGMGPGIVVLHAWWGLSNTIQNVCSRLAKEGFVAFAPDFYNGQIALTIPEAERLSSELDSQQAMTIIRQSVEYLSNHHQVHDGGLGVIGFSLGAAFALNLSEEDPDRIKAVVLFYGTGSTGFKKSKAAYLGHFAGTDPYEPEEHVDNLEKELSSCGLEVTFHRYDYVGHWFFESDRPEVYDAESSRLAWDRTITFLQANLFG